MRKSILLDQFFTKKELAKELFLLVEDYLQKYDISFDCWLEPSAGAGAFYNLMPKNKIGIDLDPQIPNIICSDFLIYNLPYQKYVTLGNPPFGKNSSLAIKFFNYCANNSEIIAFIVPKTFKKISVINKLNYYFHLEISQELPEYSFELEGKNYNVSCVFQIWRKKTTKRVINKPILVHNDFQFCSRENANFAIQRVGVKAGTLKKEFLTVATQSHYFIKATEKEIKIFESVDWSSVKYNTAGNPSISKNELISLYEQKKYMENLSATVLNSN